MISVPAYTRHWFTLTDLKKVKAIRIFESKDGWVAVYDESLIPADKAKVL